MAMTYNSLTASKGTSGAIATWVNYTLLDVATVLAEAQTLIYQTLRVREMRVSASLTLANGTNTIALPGASTGQFLEPVSLYDQTAGVTFIPNDERYVTEQRLLQLQGATLASGSPGYVAIFNEAFNFDVNASATHTMALVYYQMPALLSSGNQSNWLTNRYPHLVRAACLAAAADFMKDTDEYNKAVQRLQLLIQRANDEAKLQDTNGITSALNKPAIDGSLVSFIGATSTPVDQVIAEGQLLLYGMLRCREMQTEYVFTMPQYGSWVALPTGFLDPIGPIELQSFNSRIRHKDQGYVQKNRVYNELSGTLGTNPFTTTSGSNLVSVYLAGHGFTQDSVFYTTGATAFNGVTIAGTFPIASITDTNDFVIDITSLATTPTASGAGGGSAVEYTCDVLVSGVPFVWGVWNERINFDQAFFQTSLCRLQYYGRPALLTSPTQSNFLTSRYPQLFRKALQAAEANMRRDHAAYDQIVAALAPLVQAANAENDMQYRGLELDPEIP